MVDMANSGILLVDDEIAYHMIVRALLEPLGRPITCVSGGYAALNAVDSAEYALILMDIEMPDIDGYRTCQMIRARGGWTTICPIIAFTSLKPAAGEDHFISAGLDGYLPKPFAMADIAAVARRWLGVRESADEAAKPGDRLAAFLGQEAAGHMIERFHAAIEEAMEAIDGGADAAPLGHRIGGLAGTLGFSALSTAWLTLQDGDDASWPTVRALTREALARRASEKRLRSREP